METISPDERSDVVWGSPQYFSPEQAAGSAPSPASDVYSLGIIFFEMLCGRLPFTASTPQEFARLHREAPPPSPRRYNPRIPVALEQIILKVLSKEPAARYRTADQLGRVLTNYAQQGMKTAGTSLSSSQANTIAPSNPYPAANGNTPGSIGAARLIGPANSYSAGFPVTASQTPASAVRPIPSQPVIIRSEPPAADMINIEAADSDVVIITPGKKNKDFDWLTWSLAFFAFLFLGGLVPFWLWVFYILNPR